MARALHAELPATAALLREGRVNAYVAGLVVTETRHLEPGARRALDHQLARELADYLQRGRTARADRRVGLRPAPDTMTVLTGFLPVEQGVACWAALRAHADSLKNTGDPRTRDQVIADTLVERVTGQVTAADVNVEIAVVIPVGALTDSATTATAEVIGHGPIPAALAKDVLAGSRGKR